MLQVVDGIEKKVARNLRHLCCLQRMGIFGAERRNVLANFAPENELSAEEMVGTRNVLCRISSID